APLPKRKRCDDELKQSSKVLLLWLSASLLLAGCNSRDNEAKPSPASASPSELTSPVAQEMEETTGTFLTQDEVENKLLIDSPDYAKYLEVVKNGPIIPGLNQKLVPQGLTIAKDKNWLVTS